MQESTPGGVVIPTESEAAFVDPDGTEVPYVRVLVSRVISE